MSYYRRKHNQNVIKHRSRLRRFLTKLENNPPKLLDTMTVQIEKEVWNEVDCLACSNCCRQMTPTFTFQDLKRIAPHFGMTIS